MAVLISKVVRSGATGAGNGRYGSSAHKSNPTHLGTFNTVVGGSANVPKSGNTFVGKLGRGMRDRRSSSGSEINLTTYSGQHGITKTIETTVIVGDGDDNHSSGSR
jgi:hypothetical protein